MMNNDKKNEILSEIENTFQDLKQTEQYDKNCPILKISMDNYSRTINNYFRTVCLSEEISLRVYRLTELIIKASATNYMAWHIRRKCIDDKSLKIDLSQEIEWVENITFENPKNYQIWHHRKLLVEVTKDFKTELEVINQVFEEDSKNYHAWCHRIWIVRRFDLYEQELSYSEKMIEQDVRNNSAWNFRFFILSSGAANKITFNFNDQVKFAIKNLIKDYDNESVYSYIKGIYNAKEINSKGELLSENSELLEVLKKGEEENSYHSISMILEINLLKKDKDEVLNNFNKLAEIDYIRVKYWKWRKSNYVANK